MLRLKVQARILRRPFSSFLNAKDLLLDPAQTPLTSPSPNHPAFNNVAAALSSQQKISAPDSFSSIKLGVNLLKYAVNLNKLASDGKLEDVVGRDKEIQQAIQVLSRRRKNNPCLIGEPGVGKTCIAEGLALLIHQGRVPQSMRDKIVVSLDLASMLAGTKFRGEFEERLKSVIKEIEACDDRIILFIDELHILVGAGGSEGSIDAANILKPSLARGTLRCLGTTTFSEYRENIAQDPALARRFQSITVAEPTEAETVQILRGLRGKYESHHRIRWPDEAVSAAVSLSARYLPSKRFPDKAIDLLDEAAARLRLQLESWPRRVDEIDAEIQDIYHSNYNQSTSNTHQMLRQGELTVKNELKLHKLHEEKRAILRIWHERNDVWQEVGALQHELQQLQQKHQLLLQQQKQLQHQRGGIKGDLADTLSGSTGTVGKDLHAQSIVMQEMAQQLTQKQEQIDALYETLQSLQARLAEYLETSDTATRPICNDSNNHASTPLDHLSVRDIVQVLSEATNIPISTLSVGPSTSSRTRLLDMERNLQAVVKGQDRAIQTLVRAIKVSRTGLRAGDRPIGVFFLLGPTGVGKTELARALAAELFPDRPASDRFLRLDMSEFMEKFNVSRLTGAPPGYIGHEEGGRLTEAVKQRPYQLILLDEFEKAHRDVSQLLLQVFDAGRLTDARGETVSFANTVILLTSNLGAQALFQLQQQLEQQLLDQQQKAQGSNTHVDGTGAEASSAQEPSTDSTDTTATTDTKIPDPHATIQALATQLVTQHFSPEFVNRLDDILVFRSLDTTSLTQIAQLQLHEIQQLLLREKGVTLVVSHPAATTRLVHLATQQQPDFGARPIRRFLQTQLLVPLAEWSLQEDLVTGDVLVVSSSASASASASSASVEDAMEVYRQYQEQERRVSPSLCSVEVLQGDAQMDSVLLSPDSGLVFTRIRSTNK